ncbi:MAG TPA: hypothetical protein VGG29_00640 [Caulobacteraceae bacterium]
MSDILEGYVDRAGLAAQLKCTSRTVQRMENGPNGLPSVVIAGRRYYRLEAVRRWLESRERRPNTRRSAA